MSTAEKVSQSAADATACKTSKSCNPEQASRRRNRSNRGNLPTGHSLPGSDYRGQTTERNLEDRLAVAGAHEGGEPLRRGQGKRA